MLDVLELEKKWSKYHLKKQLPLYITSFVVILIAGSASLLYFNDPDLIKKLITKDDIAIKAPSVVKHVDVVPVKKEPAPYKQNVLHPSFSFMYNLEDQVISYDNTKVLAMVESNQTEQLQTSQPNKKTKAISKEKKKPIASKKKSTYQSKQSVKQKIKQPTKQPSITPKETVKIEPEQIIIPNKEIHIVAESESSQSVVEVHRNQISPDELNSVIRRFNNQANPALSLFIAKNYYDLGNYQESYNYALATNKLNPNIEDSILIFSRSLVKLGQKEKAIDTLESYIKKSGSYKAKMLLSEIKKGNFT
ncbi:MAG: hypothetical protein PF439_10780 [Helicobacteraceae bacterium]|jgi:tetratricopeptide (TPR) repeat protein|nr:hypothetical protein [Helicobacteraceae bacterium]